MATLVDRLTIDRDDASPDVFVSRDPADEQHVFGGLLVGQALRAAQLTAASHHAAHSVHASFVEAGIGGTHIRYEVERTRDGSSFSTRRVVARQERGVVMVMTAAFHHDEPGLDYEVPATPDVPGPDSLTPGRMQSRVFESRDVPVVAGGPAHARRSWYRARSPLPEDPHLHLQALAYLSDHGPSRAAREPHRGLPRDAIERTLSLDHSLWFHRPVDVNQWLLVELLPVATGRGRGLSVGTIRSVDGTLVASLAQEILLRPTGGASVRQRE
jgi:acyl-CoA thioesterase-2